MKRRYETMFILDPGQEEEKLKAQVKKVEEMILAAPEGEVISIDVWGKKRLAYEIKGKQFGYYVVVEFRADSSFITDLNTYFRYDPQVIRALVIAIPQKVIKLKKRQEELKEREAERRAEAKVSGESKVVDMLEEAAAPEAAKAAALEAAEAAAKEAAEAAAKESKGTAEVKEEAKPAEVEESGE